MDARTPPLGRGTRPRRRLLLVAAGVALGLVLSACGKEASPSPTTGAAGDVTVLTTPGGGTTIQPTAPPKTDVVALRPGPGTTTGRAARRAFTRPGPGDRQGRAG